MRGTASAIVCALVLAGCGDSGPQLAPIERQELHAFVERARSAATTRDLAATNAALEALQAHVRALRERGRIDGETAERLLKYSAIAQLRARSTLRSEAAPAPEADPPAAPAAPEAEPDPAAAPAAEADPGGGNDKGDDKAKDKNKNKDDDKDKGGGNGNGKADE